MNAGRRPAHDERVARPAEPSVARSRSHGVDASFPPMRPRWLVGVTWRLIGTVVAIACAFSVPFVLQTAFDAETRPLASLILFSSITAGLTLVFVGALLLAFPGPAWWRPVAVAIAASAGCLAGAGLSVLRGDPYQQGYNLSAFAAWLYRARQMAPKTRSSTASIRRSRAVRFALPRRPPDRRSACAWRIPGAASRSPRVAVSGCPTSARLTAMYAGRGTLCLEVNGPRGTVATLELPLRDARMPSARPVEALAT